MSKKSEKTIVEQELNVKKVAGRVTILKVIPYRGVLIYLRKIGADYIEYVLSFEGEVYSSYMIFTPSKGRKNLTPGQVARAGALVFAGATATVDYLFNPEFAKQNAESIIKRKADLEKKYQDPKKVLN